MCGVHGFPVRISCNLANLKGTFFLRCSSLALHILPSWASLYSPLPCRHQRPPSSRMQPPSLLSYILLAYLLSPLTHAAPELRYLDLLRLLQRSLQSAYSSMQGYTAVLPSPLPFYSGGNCYSGYGTSINYSDCNLALSAMPPEALRPGDVVVTRAGEVLVVPVFEQYRPMVWRHGTCIIGVSIYDVANARGLYKTFRDAAKLIINQCVSRATGGLVRYAQFEVVIFDDAFLPKLDGDYVRAFARWGPNIPFSKGLATLWRLAWLQ